MDTNELKLRLKRLGIDVKDSAGKLTKNAVDGSKKLSEKMRVQSTIRKAESQLKQTYAEIGQKYEELYSNRNDEAFAPYMTKLADLRAQIASARAELSAIESASVCQTCGKHIMEGQKFCPHCGARIIRSEHVEAEVVTSDASVQEKPPKTGTDSESENEYQEY